ncbi:MAG: T9SS type A sorting domain-containing protein [Bacteroidia bacterium]|nr:T9SS type A sorting domain-containing protein [Bacteroidia bacterium]
MVLNVLNNNISARNAGVFLQFGQAQTHNINNNIINATTIAGIYCLDNGGADLTIKLNTLTAPSPPFNTAMGVRVENATMLPIDVKIGQNTINMFKVGVYMNNLTTLTFRPEARYNIINFPATVFSPRYGIIARMSDNVFIDVNTVTKVGGAPTGATYTRYFGAYVENCIQSTVSNNTFTRMGNGVVMDINNAGSKLTCNNFTSNWYPFNFGFGSGGSEIGDQYIPSNPNDNLYLTAPGSGFDLTGTIFPTPIQWYFRPIPLFNLTSNTANLTPNPSFNQTACDAVGPPSIIQRENDFGQIVRNQFSFPQNDPENKLWGWKKAYRFFKNNPSMLILGAPDDSTYQNFFLLHQAGNVGALQQVTDLIEIEDFNSASNMSSTVNPNYSAELNRKEVNRIYLSTWALGVEHFSVADSAMLYNIAYLDPVIGGDAVYSARAMLRLLIEPVPFNARMQQVTFAQDDKGNGRIYPNPTTGKTQLEFVVEEGIHASLEIFSITGQRILSISLGENEAFHQLDLGGISPGVYLYKVISAEEVIVTDKIIIVE